MTNPRDQIGGTYQAEEYSPILVAAVSVSMMATTMAIISLFV